MTWYSYRLCCKTAPTSPVQRRPVRPDRVVPVERQPVRDVPARHGRAARPGSRDCFPARVIRCSRHGTREAMSALSVRRPFRGRVVPRRSQRPTRSACRTSSASSAVKWPMSTWVVRPSARASRVQASCCGSGGVAPSSAEPVRVGGLGVGRVGDPVSDAAPGGVAVHVVTVCGRVTLVVFLETWRTASRSPVTVAASDAVSGAVAWSSSWPSSRWPLLPPLAVELSHGLSFCLLPLPLPHAPSVAMRAIVRPATVRRLLLDMPCSPSADVPKRDGQRASRPLLLVPGRH